MGRYPVPSMRTRVEQTILRSRFLTTAERIASVAEAKVFIDSMRNEFADATHNCYAFVAGPPGSTAQCGMSDDGEPSGTAGKPMLAVLLGSGIGDIATVVTRYYGGAKLGTGGLVRAYAGGVKAVLAELAVVEKVAKTVVVARGEYRWIDPLGRLLPGYEAEIVEQEFAEDVRWTIEVPVESSDALCSAIMDLSKGSISLERGVSPDSD